MRRAAHGATATVTCATAKSSLDTPVLVLLGQDNGTKTKGTVIV